MLYRNISVCGNIIGVGYNLADWYRAALKGNLSG